MTRPPLARHNLPLVAESAHSDRGSGAEQRLLLACAASELTPARTARVTEAARAHLDWEAIHRRAWDHGVLPLVYRQLAAAKGEGAPVPAVALESLSASATAIAANNLRLSSALVELLRGLDSAGVPAIAYKGPSLAARAYGNLALRHFNDLDVLIRREGMTAATAAMAALGYRLRDPASGSARRATLRWGHHFSFAREPQTLVEVHWRFYKPLFGSSLPEGDVWGSVFEYVVADQRIRTLGPLHEMLVLATHGSWHGWSQLSWVCDVAELTSHGSDLDFAALLNYAQRHRLVRPLLLAFELAHLLLDVPIPPPIADAMRGHPGIADAAAALSRGMLTDDPRRFENARLQFTLREGITDRVGFALRALFLPNPADLQAVHLPPVLFPLYYVLRPFRVALKYRPRAARGS